MTTSWMVLLMWQSSTYSDYQILDRRTKARSFIIIKEITKPTKVIHCQIIYSKEKKCGKYTFLRNTFSLDKVRKKQIIYPNMEMSLR